MTTAICVSAQMPPGGTGKLLVAKFNEGVVHGQEIVDASATRHLISGDTGLLVRIATQEDVRLYGNAPPSAQLSFKMPLDPPAKVG